MDLNPRPFALKATTPTTAPRRPHTKDQSPGLLTVDVCLDSNPLTMELDTGAAVSLIIEATYKRLWSATSSRPKLKPTDSTLRGYTGNQLRVLGTIDVHVKVTTSAEPTKQCRLELFVVGGTGRNLFGRSWLKSFRLDWPRILQAINRVDNSLSSPGLESILQKYSGVFSDGLGTYTGPAVTINVDKKAVPKFLFCSPDPLCVARKSEPDT